jgi:hypothetical protein
MHIVLNVPKKDYSKNITYPTTTPKLKPKILDI